MSSQTYSMSDKAYSKYGNFKAPGCACGGISSYNFPACTLAPPQPYVHACHPAAFSRAQCQSSQFFPLGVAYGRW